MNQQRMAAMTLIIAGVKNDGFPKISDDRKVAVKVESGNVRKNVADDIVFDRPRIEHFHQGIDILAVLNICFHGELIVL